VYVCVRCVGIRCRLCDCVLNVYSYILGRSFRGRSAGSSFVVRRRMSIISYVVLLLSQ
jgi:hypothetical protein